jgi:hypothetical protein
MTGTKDRSHIESTILESTILVNLLAIQFVGS